jgi:hypothetical protein
MIFAPVVVVVDVAVDVQACEHLRKRTYYQSSPSSTGIEKVLSIVA